MYGRGCVFVLPALLVPVPTLVDGQWGNDLIIHLRLSFKRKPRQDREETERTGRRLPPSVLFRAVETVPLLSVSREYVTLTQLKAVLKCGKTQ